MTAIIVFLIGLLIIGGLWSVGHPAIIDRGEGQPRKFFDKHTKWHLLGALVIGAFVAIVDGFWPGFLVSSALWSLVEVAQKNPRDRKGGFAELSDFCADGVGALLGALLGAWLQ